jgi:uncharacterized protein (DUF58 family)
MRVAKPTIFLAAVGIFLLLMAVKLRFLLNFTYIYDMVLAAALLSDFLLAMRPAKVFTVERQFAEQLSLGTDNRIQLLIRLRSEAPGSFRHGRTFTVLVKDEPPVDFTAKDPTEKLVVLSSERREAVFNYHVTPLRQGDYDFGKIYLMVTGPLRLVQLFDSLPLQAVAKVYPNLQETEKYDLLARKGLLMQVGIRSMRMRGAGSEFESLREYVVGDEYRKIDWSATARRGKLISRQYNVEKAQNIMLVLDCGRTMLQQVQKMTKLDFAINTALMLGYVAASQDDKVGLVTFDAELRTFIPPAKGKAQVFRLLSSLYNVSAQMTESDYQNGFLALATRWRRRSLVVFFTDLIDPVSSAEILNAISLVEKRHRVLCVTVADPTILAAASLDPTSEIEVYRKSVALQVLQERRSAISLLKRRNVWTIDSPPETLSADLINKYLELKARTAI